MISPAFHCLWAIWLILVLAVTTVCSQDTGVDGVFSPVDQSIADRGALSTSLREVSAGIHDPRDFDQVYRLTGRDDLYLRAQGGLYAVFPQSVYAEFQGRSIPVIPNGTVFYIGRHSLMKLQSENGLKQPVSKKQDGIAQPPLRIDTRLRTAVPDPPFAGISPIDTAITSDPADLSQPATHEDSPLTTDTTINGQHIVFEPRVLGDRSSRTEKLNASIVHDPQYRSRRLHQLLQQAVRNLRSQSSPTP